jgi:hypothetical protein
LLFEFLSFLFLSESPLGSALVPFVLALLPPKFGLVFLGDAKFAKYLFTVFLELFVVLVEFFLILCDAVGVVDVEAEVVLFLFVLVLILLLLLEGQVFPVVLDELVDVCGGGVLVLLGVLGVPLLEEPGVGSERFALAGELGILFIQVVLLAEADVVDLFVVLFFVIGEAFPLFGEGPGHVVPGLGGVLGAFFAGSFEEEAHEGVHGGFGGLDVGDAQTLLQEGLVLFVAVLVGLHLMRYDRPRFNPFKSMGTEWPNQNSAPAPEGSPFSQPNFSSGSGLKSGVEARSIVLLAINFGWLLFVHNRVK